MDYNLSGVVSFYGACIIALFLLVFLYQPYKNYVKNSLILIPYAISKKIYPVPLAGTGTALAPTVLDYSFFLNTFVTFNPVSGTTTNANSFITLPTAATLISELSLKTGDTLSFTLNNNSGGTPGAGRTLTFLNLAGRGYNEVTSMGNELVQGQAQEYKILILDAAKNLAGIGRYGAPA